MDELYIILATFIGVPLLLVGWIWSIVVAKRISTRWLLLMIFLFVFALPALAVYDWRHSRGPFIVTTTGALLLLGMIPLL